MCSRFGQLGCSGFIVSDRDGNFVSRKTKAFLQYEEGAFRDVEKILAKSFDIRPESSANPSSDKLQVDVLSPDWTLPSVGVASMDQEHKECESALSLLQCAPNVKTLTHALEALTARFQVSSFNKLSSIPP